METEDGVHRLEGLSDQKGGLIVKKKVPTFKVPQPSLLGLDKLAEQKRRDKKDAERKMSFSMDMYDGNEETSTSSQISTVDKRKYRSPHEETPTYTGGISEEARERLLQRLNSNKNKIKGVYASTKDSKREKYKTQHTDYRDDYNKRQKNYYDRDNKSRSRNKEKSERDKSDQESSRRDSKTPRFKDEPQTPNIKLKNDPCRTSWDDEEETVPVKKSAWDFPTPTAYKTTTDWSERSTDDNFISSSSWSDRRSQDQKRHKYQDDTPRPTPAHRFNAWAKDRKKSGATPGKSDGNLKWDATVDRELWEEEQKRIDREWYGLDEGNVFFSIIRKCHKHKP